MGVMFGQPQIISLRARAETQGSEVEPDDFSCAPATGQFAAVNVDFFRLPLTAGSQLGKQGGQLGFVFRTIRYVEHVGGSEVAVAVVFTAVYIENGELALHQGDGGQETAAVLPLRIEFGRSVVGGGYQYHAFGKQFFQQAAEYHGIGNVADMEFVKTQYAGFFGNIAGNGLERIGLMALVAHPLVDFGHKGVKVHAAFAPLGQAAEKGVHQETFAAADAAVEIQAGGHLRRAQAAAEKAVALALEHHQFRPQLVEIFDGARLGGIADKAGLLGGGLIPGERAVVVKRRRNKAGLCHRIFRLRGGRNSAPRGGYGLENRAAR